MRVNVHNFVDSCAHREYFELFGTCSLLSFPLLTLLLPPFPRLEQGRCIIFARKTALSAHPPSPTNSRRNCHMDVSVGGRGRTSLRVAPRRFARSLARWAFLKLHRFTQRSLHDSRGVTVDLHYLREGGRAFSHFRVGGERFVNVDGRTTLFWEPE